MIYQDLSRPFRVYPRKRGCKIQTQTVVGKETRTHKDVSIEDRKTLFKNRDQETERRENTLEVQVEPFLVYRRNLPNHR